VRNIGKGFFDLIINVVGMMAVLGSLLFFGKLINSSPSSSNNVTTNTSSVEETPSYENTYDEPSSDNSSSSGTSAYYANCTEAKASGNAPIYVGEAGYRSALDRDGDGIACE
jgi:hypothetical protein